MALDLKMAIMGLCGVLLLVGVFFLGGLYTCDAGDGSLIGLKCTQMKELGVCEDLMGNKYKVDDIPVINGTIWWEN